MADRFCLSERTSPSNRSNSSQPIHMRSRGGWWAVTCQLSSRSAVCRVSSRCRAPGEFHRSGRSGRLRPDGDGRPHVPGPAQTTPVGGLRSQRRDDALRVASAGLIVSGRVLHQTEFLLSRESKCRQAGRCTSASTSGAGSGATAVGGGGAVDPLGVRRAGSCARAGGRRGLTSELQADSPSAVTTMAAPRVAAGVRRTGRSACHRQQRQRGRLRDLPAAGAGALDERHGLRGGGAGGGRRGDVGRGDGVRSRRCRTNANVSGK